MTNGPIQRRYFEEEFNPDEAGRLLGLIAEPGSKIYENTNSDTVNVVIDLSEHIVRLEDDIGLVDQDEVVDLGDFKASLVSRLERGP